MPDVTLICANCANQFVFSEGEQAFYAQKGLELPSLCPICRALKQAQRSYPAKPPPPSR